MVRLISILLYERKNPFDLMGYIDSNYVNYKIQDVNYLIPPLWVGIIKKVTLYYYQLKIYCMRGYIT